MTGKRTASRAKSKPQPEQKIQLGTERTGVFNLKLKTVVAARLAVHSLITGRSRSAIASEILEKSLPHYIVEVEKADRIKSPAA